MTAVAVAVQLAAAGALLLAAAAKAAAPSRVRATIAALGLRPAAGLHGALVAAEAGAAVALAVAPGATATRALVLGLGLVFAGAGLRTHLRGETISCACFGGRASHPLGLRQVAALPGWVLAATVPGASPLDGGDGLTALTAVAVAGGLAVSVPLLEAVRRNRTAVALVPAA